MVLIAGIGLAQSSPVQAQASSDEVLQSPSQAMASRRFLQFFGSRDFQKQLYDTGVAWDQVRGALCNDGEHKILPLGVGEVIQPLMFSGQSTIPARGVFTAAFNLIRCGRTMVYKVLVQAKPGASGVEVERMLPGDTVINFQLYRDTFQPLRQSAASIVGKHDCQQIVMLDTSASMVLESDLPAFGGGKGERRRERWWYRVCGSVAVVDLTTFPSPSRPGLSYSIAPAPGQPALVLR